MEKQQQIGPFFCRLAYIGILKGRARAIVTWAKKLRVAHEKTAGEFLLNFQEEIPP